MAKRRRRARGFPATSLVPPTGALAGWGYLHEPFQARGLLVLLALGAVLGIMMPAVLLSLRDVPKLMVPSRWRARYRHWRALGDHWCFLWWCVFPVTDRGEQHSSYIPKYLRRAVLRTDGYQCAWCHATASLQVDHVKPWAAGGLVVFWNLMVLCEYHNRVKSNYWVARDGYVFYRPFSDANDPREAAQILAFERRRRWSPARWVRAGFALAA